VRGAFTVAWKNARAKAPYTAEVSLVKPAVGEIMCSGAATQGCITKQHCMAKCT